MAGSIEPYRIKAGKRYKVRYRTPDKKQTEKNGFTTRRDAEAFLATIEVSKLKGEYIDPNRARVTVSQWMDEWLTSRSDLRQTTRDRVESIIALHINPPLGDRAIGSLDRLTLQRWASNLQGAPETVKKIVNVLSGALTLAVQDERLAKNHAHKLKLPKITKTRKRYLTHQEVSALVSAVESTKDGREHGFGVATTVLCYCGLRWGELAGLRVQDVDLKKRVLHIEQTVVLSKGQQRIEPPKDYEHRDISIPLFLIEPLRAQIAGRAPGAPVFPGPRTGTWLRNTTYRGWLDPAAASIGLPGLTPHEMRHTTASLAVSAGANVKAVQRMLGHASAAVTLDIYADLFDSDLEAVAIRLHSAAMDSGVGDLWGNPKKPALRLA